jgi:poly-gamma-glutamate synthesis protein (capsule biosynthesis protein)
VGTPAARLAAGDLASARLVAALLASPRLAAGRLASARRAGTRLTGTRLVAGRLVGAGCAGLLLLLTSCSSPAPPSTPPSAASSAASSSASSPTPPDGSPSPPARAVLAFAGDVHFTGRTLRLLRDPQNAFGPFASVLSAADFAMVNLETAVTSRGTPQPKTYHFRAPPSAYDAIKAAGVDLVSAANNHTLDYGRVGLVDTLESARKAGMPLVGAGRNAAAAYAPHLVTVRGLRLAVLAFSQVHALSSTWRATDSRPGIAVAFDLARTTAAVRAAQAQADLVIVFMHWGVEGSQCPSGEMKTFAGRMAAAGADVVVGTHAHVLLADGWKKGTYVHYGLGNFVWYTGSHSTDTGVLRLTVGKEGVVKREFLPGVVSATGQPVPATGAAKRRVERKLAQAAKCTGLSESARQ